MIHAWLALLHVILAISFLQSILKNFLNAQTPANNRFEVGTGTLAANNRIVFYRLDQYTLP
jgi:hypothetical protein